MCGSDVLRIFVGLSLLAGDAHAACMTTNHYDAYMYELGECGALIASGGYTCAATFAHGMKYASLCDFSCGFNVYDTRTETMGCERLLASGLYECAKHFATSAAYAGDCDFSCGFCTGRSELRRRKLQDLPTCVTATQTIGNAAADVTASHRRDVSFANDYGPARGVAIGAITDAMTAGFQRIGSRQTWSQSNQVYACTLWQEIVHTVGTSRSDSHGGAVYVSTGVRGLVVRGSAFIGNSAIANAQAGWGRGGAIFVGQSAHLEVSGSAFIGNSASYNGAAAGVGGMGGALYIWEGAQADLRSSTFVGNSAYGLNTASGSTGQGGAIASRGANTRMEASGCTFVGNSVYGDWGGRGGAILTSNGFYTSPGPEIFVTDSTFTGNSGAIGYHIQATETEQFYVYNTSFDPFEERLSRSMFVNVLSGCEQYPCSHGFGCSYVRYSLMCTACPPPLVGRDGIRCTLDFACPPGMECAAAGGCTDESQCTLCRNGTVSDGAGECIVCNRLGERSNNARTACVPCGAGTEPSSDRSHCVPCGEGNFSALGVCQRCLPPNHPTTDLAACVPPFTCPPGKECTATAGCTDESQCSACAGNQFSEG
eukprot:COSAG02_NODE_10195_length_1997_cov_4.878820_1_plen_596_part_01